MLYDEILCRVDKSVKKFLQEFSKKYDLDFEEMCELQLKNDKCQHKMTNGKNKGENCTAKPLENGFCKKNQTTALKLNIIMSESNSPTKNTTKKVPKVSATQQKIIELLETPNPHKHQETITLKKMELGNLEVETKFIFNDNFSVIGKLENDKLVPLNDKDIDYCDIQCWDFE